MSGPKIFSAGQRACWISREDDFGGGEGSDSFARFKPNDGLSSTTEQAMLPVGTVTTRQTNDEHPVRGPKTGTIKLSVDLLLPEEQLTAAAADPTDPSVVGRFLRAAFGGFSAAKGSTVVASGTDANTIVMASGDGANFPHGQPFLVVYSSELHVMYAKTVSTDTVEAWPPLGGVPSNGAVVVNTHCFYLAPDASESLTFRSAAASAVSGASEDKEEHRGCKVESFAFKHVAGQIVTFDIALTSSDWDNPSIASMDLSDYVEAQVGPVRVVGGRTVITSSATARTEIDIMSITFSYDTGYEFQMSPGGFNNRIGAHRTKRPMPKCEVVLPYDTDYFTAFTAGTVYRIEHRIPLVGTSGSTERGFVIGSHGAKLLAMPEHVTQDGIQCLKLSFALHETDSSFFAADTALSRSNLFVAEY